MTTPKKPAAAAPAKAPAEQMPPPAARARVAQNRPPAAPPRAGVPAAKPIRLKVRATMLGYYDHVRRHEGDVFYIDGSKTEAGIVPAFSHRWMEVVDEGERERTTSAQQNINRQHDEMLGGRVTGRPTGDDDPLNAGNQSDDQ